MVYGVCVYNMLYKLKFGDTFVAKCQSITCAWNLNWVHNQCECLHLNYDHKYLVCCQHFVSHESAETCDIPKMNTTLRRRLYGKEKQKRFQTMKDLIITGQSWAGFFASSWWRHQMERFSALLAIFDGEFTSPRWIPLTKASDAELWCFLWSTPE